ncbi:MAG: phosphoribosylanthranilate isomerase [Hyphomicrobiales bacterium]
MSDLILKICGLSTRETLTAAIDAGADWVGLVTFAPSPRHVSPVDAKPLADLARGKTKIVSLSVNADDQLLDEIMTHVDPEIWQFHGKETAERVAEVKTRYKRPVMKAIGVSTIEDLEKITPYRGVADYVLLDAKPPKDAILPGGNGAAFDWTILNHLPADIEFMLSGGLSVETVADAVRSTRAFGMDVSSGVESSSGVKDIALIKRFIENARAA